MQTQRNQFENAPFPYPASVKWSDYPLEFQNWLRHNRSLYSAFEEKALRMAKLRKRYSARAIIHVIRWETELRDADVTFKCNNNWTPMMARLFMERFPCYDKFFETRS